MLLMVLPAKDYDPTESAVPYAALRRSGHAIEFATPDGNVAYADERLVDTGFGPLSPILMTRGPDLERYRQMTEDPSFNAPIAYDAIDVSRYDGLVVPGGHAQGMKTMLESATLQDRVVQFFAAEKKVAAVCHGVLLLARSHDPKSGRSVLHGRKTTALTRSFELSGFYLTALWLGRYYRTYPMTVEDEVKAALASPGDFDAGPFRLIPERDTDADPSAGFIVRDRNYVSARWPGDCHRFARELVELFASDEKSERPRTEQPA